MTMARSLVITARLLRRRASGTVLFTAAAKWAKLDFPNSNLQTQLTEIGDADLIIGTTIRSSFQAGSFLYKNGTFKKIIMPNSNVPTYAEAVSPGKNLITGFSGYKGFIATCK